MLTVETPPTTLAAASSVRARATCAVAIADAADDGILGGVGDARRLHHEGRSGSTVQRPQREPAIRLLHLATRAPIPCLLVLTRSPPAAIPRQPHPLTTASRLQSHIPADEGR